MLGLDGRAEGEETVLDHLSGYRDSRPVRVGNSAFAQHQFDVHGQVLDAAFVHQQAALGTEEELTAEELSAAYAVVDEAARRWREPDEGIWEVRRGRRHWTISKVYAWVCFEELCARAGRFGLFSEEMTAEGAMLGNYPQAFTHLAQIDAAMNLDAADDEESLRAWAERTA
jgi:GH15 family glucan-1,4-alpha-glucosidase